MNLAPNRHRQAWLRLALFLAAPVAALVLPACVAAGPAGAGVADALPAAGTSVRADDGPSPAPRWPLDLPGRWLTSNFMEYRGGRFHAGVDFKTREQEGFPAFAVTDGWVSRVRATPGGYGRAVYLQDAAGRTYVYAHLGRFCDRLETLVRGEQARTGAYRAELELSPGAVPVARGEVLGLTGQSGTLGPHLHFEVRDAAGRPVDPLANGFAVRDTIAPVIHHVRAVPASPAARIAGGAAARLLPVAGRPWPGGQAPALAVSGPVAFSARIVEATDPAGHRLEPWLIELRVDGEVACRRANESFDFADNARQRLEWLECDGSREQWLHRDPAATVPGREGGLWWQGADGQGLAPGKHMLELVAVDRAGNRSSVAWELLVAARGEPAPTTGRAAWEEAALGTIVDDNVNRTIVLTPLFDVIDEHFSGRLVRLQPGPGSPALAPVALAAAPPIPLAAVQREQAARQGLVPAGDAVRWAAAGWPLEAAPLVDWTGGLPPAAETPDPAAAVYRWNDQAWTPAGALLPAAQEGGPARFALPQPGLFAVLRDTLPPVIAGGVREAGPHPGFGLEVSGVTPPRWAVLDIGIAEDGSGVDTGALRARWNGAPLVVEPDLLRGRILVEVPGAAAAGEHRLEVEAADVAGRRAHAVITVRCVAPAEGR